MDTVKCTVVGPCPIAGADGKDVNPGGAVELDPAHVNIQALIDGGHVELATKAAERRMDKQTTAGG